MTKKHDKKPSEIEELKSKIKELEEMRARIQADFDNYRKRAEEQKLNIISSANADLMLEIVPVLDNFRRAFSHAKADDQFAMGIKQIEKQLEEILTTEGLQKIDTSGKFDPNIHEAISYEENDKIPADYIIGEAESGWIFNGKVLKPAKVRVSKGK